jgi:anti-sigma regulatory factor (Ser/Thr protein kinase)
MLSLKHPDCLHKSSSMNVFFLKKTGFTICALLIVLFVQAQTQAVIDSLKGELASAKNDTNKVKLLNQICLQLSYNDPKEAIHYGQTAYALSEKLHWKRGMAEATRYIAAMMVDAANEDSTLFYLQRSYDLYKDLNDTDGMIANIYNTGAFQQHTSRYSEAMESFFKGIDLAGKSGNNALLAKGNSLAGTVLVQQKDFEKARRYSLKALDVFRKLNQVDGQLECLEMIGYGYMMENKLKEAKPWLMEALQLAEATHNDLARAKIYTQLVTYSEYANEPANRLQYLQQAQAIWDKIGPSSIYSIANIANIGSLYLDLYLQPALLAKMPDSVKSNKAHFLLIAETQVQKAIELSEKEKNPDLLSQLHRLNAQVLETEGKYKGALDNFKQYVQIHDSMFSQENKNKIAAIEVNKELQLKDKTIALNKARNRQIWLYAALSLALVIMASVYFINRYRISQLNLRNALLQREAEQTQKDLVYQNQLTQSELKAIRAQMNPHFFFNVLNSIESYIIENEARTASRLLQKFASLCRLILENSTQPLVNAEREWKALQLYAELEAERFSHQFSYTFEKHEQVWLSKILIPPMMVQPLLENAIHHGLRHAPGTGRYLKVSVRRSGETLIFVIEDNGIGLAAASKREEGLPGKEKSMGLSMIKERIHIINHSLGKEMATFSLCEKTEAGQGVIATLVLPAFGVE